MVNAILITIILLAVYMAIRSIVKGKAKSCGCGCGCSGCPSNSICNEKTEIVK